MGRQQTHENRLETYFGDLGMPANGIPPKEGLKPFAANYRFNGRTWSIYIWSKDLSDAKEIAKEYGFTDVGAVLKTGDLGYDL